jgi:pyruvate/2-oxoacid:ferredoxin oxidoreductase beta subunit/Pyruvate/2-oxoacid:ferredoxin oxidoreductase delta subunit
MTQPLPAPVATATGDALRKPVGEPLAPQQALLAGAPTLFDVRGYVDDFNSAIVGAYRGNTADRELPADTGVARSIIPPATAAIRDFSGLSPLIPDLVREACVGCMACVSACPDTAILGIAVPQTRLDEKISAFAAVQPDPSGAAATAEAHFTRTQKYADLPARKGLDPAQFGLFVDPLHCKGCSECVTVCHELGHDALRMVEKAAVEPSGERTLERVKRDFRFFRTLPVTPPEYRNEKALADLMLGENALGYVGGAGSCSGCGEATAIRMVLAATRQVHGPESMGLVASTGCNSVFGATYPFNPYRIPWTNSLFENSPAVALGIRASWDAAGHEDRKLWVVGGDGAMYDIGFQALSRMIASGADIKVLVLDTQVYSNTGGQSSTATFGGQVTKLSAFGKVDHGRLEPRKELGRILMAHGNAYIAQTTPAHINHFYRSVIEANEFPGPAVLVAYSACLPEHGIADDLASHQSKMAVDARAFPLFTYDPRRGERLSERLSLQGNPALREDWSKGPDGTEIDFLSFARTEGRFAPHFGADGAPSPEIIATRDDRLANWRMLQELAGIS